ncbi:PAS domain S-box protein [Alteraurantiacibacter aquimixticola]|uniref:histidine kinase n=2 Tax=Alteraurantiacibacter aquimixticola TaxID=2489173 RepID=A0A4T3F1P1_9SPHN|nr:PAS domain S-box protein [Alteraurantiacibacter aquimixticola]
MREPAPEYTGDEARLRVLREFEAEALEDDPELQAIVNFAAQLCNAPVSVVSLVEGERQFFIARTGLEERETPREISFCTHALGQADMLEVPDATSDSRFADNPLVTGDPGIRYYAGQPLVSDEGAPLGTLCVIDTKAHAQPLTAFQREGLAVLAQAAMRRMSARREERAASREIARSEERFRALADSMPDMAFSANHEGKFDYFNERWKEFTGFGTFDEEAGKRVLHPDEYDAIMERWGKAVANGEPYEQENRLRRADGEWRWMLIRALPANVAEGRRRWFGTITDVDEAHKLSESRDMLAKELSHRIKNIFAVVSGLISLESRKQPEHAEFAAKVNETLRALGRAHDFVRPADGSTGESLLGLLDVLFAPYRDGEGSPRVAVDGDDGAIGHRAATPLALVFHELATNSAKYGALSTEEGRVSLTISAEGDALRLDWKEQGGPPPQDNGENGFGSRMVELAVTGQLQGKWERRFEGDGLAVSFDLPREAIAP